MRQLTLRLSNLIHSRRSSQPVVLPLSVTQTQQDPLSRL